MDTPSPFSARDGLPDVWLADVVMSPSAYLQDLDEEADIGLGRRCMCGATQPWDCDVRGCAWDGGRAP